MVSQLFFKKDSKTTSPKFLLLLTPLICYLSPGSRREEHSSVLLQYRTACSGGTAEVVLFALYVHIRQVQEGSQ